MKFKAEVSYKGAFAQVIKFLCFLLIFSLVLPGPGILRAEDSVYEEDVEDEVFDEEDVLLEEKLQQKIDLDYKDADLGNVLRSLSWTYDLNIVTSPDIKGRVTITLKNVTVEKALDAILTINSLTYSIRSGIIYVSQGDTEAVELTSEVIFLKYVKAADAQNMLRDILSSKGDMKIDEMANSILIIDFALNIKKVKMLLEVVDLPPKQVLIEAMIVDITSSDLMSVGVKWEMDYDPGHGIFGRSTKSEEQLQYTMNMEGQSSKLTGGQFSLDALTFKGLPNFTATIDALAKDGKANVLASPSIAVINGQEARIVIGERYPYKERTQTTTGTTETTKFVDIGTTLRVTPQVNDDGYITMRVHPEVSSLLTALDAGPRITTREADTTVRIRENETLIIGGLIKHSDNSSKERIPILGSIPVLGFLFSRSEKDVEQKELVVFITPHILTSREEQAKMDEAEREKVYVSLSSAANNTLVEEIFRKAVDSDNGVGLASRRKSKDFQKSQALDLYKYIYYEYPDSIRAPEALYGAGEIYFKHNKDYARAKHMFSLLIADYPQNEYSLKAQKKYVYLENEESQVARYKRRSMLKITQEELKKLRERDLEENNLTYIQQQSLEKLVKEAADTIGEKTRFSRPKALDSKAVSADAEPVSKTEETFVEPTSKPRVKGKGLNLVERIFEKARELDIGISGAVSSMQENVRKLRALDLYEYISYEYAENLRAPAALYYAGLIYRDYKKDKAKARETFLYLISEYPDSEFARMAKGAV
ncbi:MAG: tetratricopeptide repeat protein [Candidatus Omnitrophota bacterium]